MALAEHAQTPAVAPQRVPLVELRNIRVSFGGVRAVDGVTIDLHPGEVVGVVGGNGAGKTTLMRTLSGARPPDSGQIFVGGQPVTINGTGYLSGATLTFGGAAATVKSVSPSLATSSSSVPPQYGSAPGPRSRSNCVASATVVGR